MGETFKLVYQKIHDALLPLQPLAPLLGCGLIVVASFCSSRPLRLLCLVVAVILLLFVAADFARSLLDKETGNASYQGPPARIPVTPFQVLLTVIVAVTYFFMIFVGLHSFVLSSGPVLLVMAPGILVFSSLAAWRNVRLWYREGADYEQALKEDEGQSHKLHIPPSVESGTSGVLGTQAEAKLGCVDGLLSRSKKRLCGRARLR